MTLTSASTAVLPALVTLLCGLAPVAAPVQESRTATSVGDWPATPQSQSPPKSQAPREGVWPLGGEVEVSRSFEPPDVRWARGHRGVDLVGSVAQPVVTSLSGEVSFAGRVAGRPVVVVRHGDTRTTYEPVLAEVSVGDHVDQGARLGWLQAVGSHCAPATCLHWGWLRGETYLDPLDLIGGTNVRLLPLWSPSTAPLMTGERLAGLPLAAPPVRPVARRGPWWPLMPWGGLAGKPS